MKYASIDKLRAQHKLPTSKLCGLLNVAQSGYQAWCAKKVVPLRTPRQLEEAKLVAAIKAAHLQGRGVYGAKRIQGELIEQGFKVSLNRIRRLRRLHGIRCTHKRKYRVTTDSKHHLPVAQNILDRQFEQIAPNAVWVADITYIPTDEGWLFLAAIKRLDSPFRPRQPVLQRCLPSLARQPRHGDFNEQARQLLGQCAYGEFFWNDQN